MAAAAIRPELSIMYVMRAVTGAAAAVDGFDSFQWTAVTIITGHSDVSSGNWKIRLQVMIESPLVPANRVVAFSAGLIKIATMRVFFFVTGNTIRLSVSKGLVCMAFSALLFAVHSEQRKRS